MLPSDQPPVWASKVEMITTTATPHKRWLWANSCLFIVDRLIEPQANIHFLEFCVTGKLPNGKVTTLPIMEGEEAVLWTVPFKEWAPAPYDSLTEDLSSQLMIGIGSNEDFNRLGHVQYHIHSWKSTIWDDMIPLSPTQWQEKGLDKSEKFDLACEYLTAVVATFDYLNTEEPQENMKGTFNLLYYHLSDFDKAINSRRSSNGIEETVSLAALWEEFIRAHYQTITTRAHSWVISHVKELRAPLLHDVASHQPPSEHLYNTDQWTLTNKLHVLAEIAITADFTILFPVDGYKGHSSPRKTDDDLQSPSFDIRCKAATSKVKLLTRVNILKDVIENPNLPPKGVAHPDSLLRTLGHQIDAQGEVRRLIRGKPEPLPPLNWIMRIQRWKSDAESMDDNPEPYQPDKFTMYKLPLSTETGDRPEQLGGDGVEGADHIKPLLKLEWFDGKELGVPENDIDAAKKHFIDMHESDDFHKRNLLNYDFLVVDSASFASYMSDKISFPSTDTSGLHPSDDQPFILSVDSTYDPDDPELRRDEMPGYEGQMRVLGSLVWSDVYAVAVEQSSTPMWRWAMDKPGVYWTYGSHPNSSVAGV
ncbi:hypothetical protein FQN49_000504 [Arthroderma sp. PD_2]|nr:hypothetical protein FQN49_000504 [Arthroderma sp. PD_2]